MRHSSGFLSYTNIFLHKFNSVLFLPSFFFKVSLDNCVEVGRIANTYNLTEVDKYVNNFILKNFPSLLGTGEFVKLPFERLAFVLSSNSLKHCTELDLFKAACRWLRYEEGRMDYASKLMKNIRFPLMNPQELINHVQTVDFMRTDNTCVNLLLEASNYQMMPYMQPVMQSERTAIRSDSAHLVTLGGVLRQQLVVSKELRLFDEKAHEWKALAPMDAPRYQHGIAVIGNFLYVVGGQSNYDTKGKTAVDTVFRYDPRYNKWMQVACLNEKRTFFHLSALKGHLYAVGGRNAAGELGKVTSSLFVLLEIQQSIFTLLISSYTLSEDWTNEAPVHAKNTLCNAMQHKHLNTFWGNDRVVAGYRAMGDKAVGAGSYLRH